MKLATSISNPNFRLNQQQNLARNWLRNDPAAATHWINNSDLPAEVKSRLLQQK
jgi:hypothetical protein